MPGRQIRVNLRCVVDYGRCCRPDWPEPDWFLRARLGAVVAGGVVTIGCGSGTGVGVGVGGAESVSVEAGGLAAMFPDASCFKYIAATNA